MARCVPISSSGRHWEKRMEAGMKQLLVLLAGASLLGLTALSGGSAFADPPPHSNQGGNGGLGGSPGFDSNRGNSANSPGHGNVNSGPPDQGQQAAPCH